jgi:hypothetical protein
MQEEKETNTCQQCGQEWPVIVQSQGRVYLDWYDEEADEILDWTWVCPRCYIQSLRRRADEIEKQHIFVCSNGCGEYKQLFTSGYVETKHQCKCGGKLEARPVLDVVLPQRPANPYMVIHWDDPKGEFYTVSKHGIIIESVALTHEEAKARRDELYGLLLDEWRKQK